jgi:hypothetical protein
MILGGHLAVAVLLTGCSGGKSSSTITTITTSTSTTTAISPSTTTPTGSASSTATSAPSTSTPVTSAGLSRCPTSQLAATDDGGQGAGGTYFGRITFRNTSEQACYLEGFPGLLHLRGDGQPHPTRVVRRGKASLVTLAPQGYASFAYSTSDGPFGSATSCPSPARLEVTPPNAFDYIVVVDHMPDCGGNIQVSAVLPGRISDYAQHLE